MPLACSSFVSKVIVSEKPWTTKLWIYDFRTNEHFTLKTNPLKRTDLDDFVACYNPENRHERKETERFKSFAYDDLIKRDKVSLDIFWLKDDSLEDSANLPDPDVIAAEIVEDLQAALDQFAQIAAALGNQSSRPDTLGNSPTPRRYDNAKMNIGANDKTAIYLVCFHSQEPQSLVGCERQFLTVERAIRNQRMAL